MLKGLRKLLGQSNARHRSHANKPVEKQSVEDKTRVLPTEEELTEFEKSYAGPQTGELLERYTAWMAGTCQRNKNCLVCLGSIRKRAATLLCSSCPRVMHKACLDKEAPHAQHMYHCPLCIKRRWHLIKPITPTQRDGQSEDDVHMKRIRRYETWHRYSSKYIHEWRKLHDDGSLVSDRKLLMDMGVVKHGKMQTVPRSATKSDDVPAKHDNSAGDVAGEAADTQEPVASQSEEDRGTEAGPALDPVDGSPAKSRGKDDECKVEDVYLAPPVDKISLRNTTDCWHQPTLL